MRHLDHHEISQISGGYSYANVVACTEGGVFLGYVAAILTTISFSEALITGMVVGAAFGLVEEVALAMDCPSLDTNAQ